jgi:hypothetical protein
MALFDRVLAARLKRRCQIARRPDNANTAREEKAGKLAMAVLPLEKDVVDGPAPIEILARVAARLGEPDRAIAALQKLLSIPSEGALASRVPLTPALLQLDPMFDPLRNDPRFQKLALSAPKEAK